MTIERHIIFEAVKSFVILTVLLVILLISTELSETLTKVLTGQYSDNAIIVLISLQTPVLLAEVLPASYYLALLTVLYRQMQDNERAIYHTMAKSDVDLLKTLMIWTALPVTLIVIYLTNIGAPIANKSIAQFINDQQNRPITDVIQPRTFIALPSTRSTFYASDASNERAMLLDVITIRKTNDKYSVILSDSLKTSSDAQGQYFTFLDGQITDYDFQPQNDTTIQTFNSLRLRFPDQKPKSASTRHTSKTSSELLSESNVNRRNSLIVLNRSYAGLYVPLFCALAIALTKYRPRSAKAGAMIIGITSYILINFSFRTLTGAFAKNDWSLWLTPWWFFVGIGLVSFVIIRRRA